MNKIKLDRFNDASVNIWFLIMLVLIVAFAGHDEFYHFAAMLIFVKFLDLNLDVVEHLVHFFNKK